MRVRLLVGANGELRDVAVQIPLGHAEADVAATCAPLVRHIERQVHRIGHKVRVEQQPPLLPLAREVVGLAVEAFGEVVLGVEDEVHVAEGVHDDGRIRHGHIARRLRARAVEMLMPGIERNREDRPCLPLERNLPARVVPDRRRSAAVKHVDHFLEQLPLRLELSAGRDLADVAVVRRAGGVVVQDDAFAATPRPRFQFNGVEIRNVEGADDVEPLRADPACVGGLPLGRELLRELFGNDCRFRHRYLVSTVAYRPATRAGISTPVFRSDIQFRAVVERR